MTPSHSLQTRAVHAGHTPDADTLSRAVPIYQTTSYLFKDADHAARLFALEEFGNIYTRLMNPTTDVLEKRVAALHDSGTGCVATASGMAAIFYAVSTLAQTGQNIVSGTNLYGGTVTLFQHTLKRFGIEVRFVDTADSRQVRDAIDGKTRLVYTESIGNPRCNVDDMEVLASAAHDNAIPLIVDNTCVPPPLFDPFEHGADIVVYSLTKMIGGHGTSVGGAVVENGAFDWKLADKFPELTEPDPAYHGVNFWDAFGSHPDAVAPGLAFTLKVRTGMLRDTGACLSPFNAQQLLLGLETLPLRAQKHCANAQAVAEFLQAHPLVQWVNYAGLPNHPDHDRAESYMPLGPGAVFGFGIKGGREAGVRFIDSVSLCSHLANILDAKTLVIHPASTTHQQLSAMELEKAGIGPDFVRISVGIEDAEDITADLDQALQKSQGTTDAS